MMKPRYTKKIQAVLRTGFWNTEAGKHSLRVGQMLKVFAKDLGMDAELLVEIGDFHDIGKGKVDYKVLYKKDLLSPSEKAIVATHTELGFDLLRSAKPEVAEGALRHHSANASDPVYIQVLRLVDVAEALSSKRCYKAPMPKSRVQEILLADHCPHLSDEANKVFWTHFDELL